MSKDDSLATTNEIYEDTRRKQETAQPDTSGPDERVLSPTEYRILDLFSAAYSGFVHS